ncbi:tRNA (carboxymethyluridine(34)-5-O)-methyltransferase NDAI_0C00970 [Naumovozyma dairenensis CBS 421]|uniref:Methyltransferase type 11 domain-containing protein n=1 Tax=Naumovozyma dairenensis (strain ATCC 10597 / BCRC 20456 / CBS 421 / NBRC 0211 / NRRL Y-12639) TaxID=1071378 RepID=G0W7J7_NAUDC|nr:hypothetical protein NDAI_0C00970 [Naumovozyma dairenensis CBS 421]CCD23758.1 hypothetical protein NDAI_0C00970 [Naumovozyma dairenensis CBS 421]
MSMADLKEQEFVHDVYNEIAPHFSQTRYKPWPIVTSFLNDQKTGTIGIDVGCGNGKYLNVNPNVFLIGSDRSSGLIECAHDINNQYNILIADGLNLPHRENTFDFAISIAVVHHWTTRERRIDAIAHIMSKVRSGGQVLIYCWALEQGESRRGYHEGMEQDVLVPWVLPETTKDTKKKGENSKIILKEKMPDLTNIPPKDRSEFIANWKKEQEEKRVAAEKERQKEEEKEWKSENDKESKTKYRFYHLYREGELEEDCKSAGGIIVKTGYEKDNWYVMMSKP